MPGWYTAAGGVPSGQIDGSYGSKPGRYEITNDNFRAYNNASITFHAGEYHFNTFELSNNVNFQIDPNIGADETVDIYITTSIVFENNSELLPAIEFSGDTTKLRFYFDGTNTVDLSNNVEFYGFIYAPNAKIEVRNNDNIFGNLVGKEVWIWNNAGVHYDKALLDEDFGNIFTGGIPAAPHERTDWKEIIISN
ncbi:MAG: collagen-binding domain-containing protein [Candidatus Auribacterota bacterium]|nr:collagen-binding domain-containing protein [Candidatus Auribacterota bacterium]